MQMLNSLQNLREEESGLVIIDSIIFNDEIEEFSGVCILHDQIKVLWRLNDLVQLNHTSVPNLL